MVSISSSSSDTAAAATTRRRRRNNLSQRMGRLTKVKKASIDWVGVIAKRHGDMDPAQYNAKENTPSQISIGTVRLRSLANAPPINTPLAHWANPQGDLPVQYRCSFCAQVPQNQVVNVSFNPVLSLPYIITCSVCSQKGFGI